MPEMPEYDGILVLPRMRIQNANCISSPLTWGFPSITAFMGFMWALQRKCNAEDMKFKGIGVVCHHFAPQVNEAGYVRSFHLTRNPLDSQGNTAPIVEEGRAHMTISLLLAYEGEHYENRSTHEQTALMGTLHEALVTMRVAGGTILPSQERSQKPYCIGMADDEYRLEQFRKMRRRFLPGFALVSRDDVLVRHRERMRERNADISLLDAWLDLSRRKWWAEKREEVDETTGAIQEIIEWKRSQRDGWIVPIPVGYAAISELYPAGDVLNARDVSTPFRFVESLYSVGQWIGPHRLNDVADLLWFAHTDDETGVYRCYNNYSAQHEAEEENI